MSLNSSYVESSGNVRSPRSISVSMKSSNEFGHSLEVATGIEIKIAENSICPGHHAPWDIFREIHEQRPSLALVLGGRGTGKSYLSALDTHLTSLARPHHGTRV